MEVKAHAKINLVLAVGTRRPDGYHEVETVLQQLELHDRLIFRAARGLRLYSDSPEVPSGPENLVWRAAVLLRERWAGDRGAEIRLYKSIPVAAGLAGGSADAAATLRGLNRLWGLNLDHDTLRGLAAELGSDVPFCLGGPTALARGRGELVIPLPPAPPAGVVLVRFPFGIRAAEAYAHFDRFPYRDHLDVSPVVAALAAGDIAGLARGLANALEPAVFDLYPEIREAKRRLVASGVLGALVSGSGPTIFGLTSDPAAAEVVAANLRSQGLDALATQFKREGPEA
jgi:4-diphosphocytidyl-2-C-methyl-D-erythritol kinase